MASKRSGDKRRATRTSDGVITTTTAGGISYSSNKAMRDNAAAAERLGIGFVGSPTAPIFHSTKFGSGTVLGINKATGKTFSRMSDS
ncbi:hypothetical protein [Corynebacterium pyruviciproducens]